MRADLDKREDILAHKQAELDELEHELAEKPR